MQNLELQVARVLALWDESYDSPTSMEEFFLLHGIDLNQNKYSAAVDNLVNKQWAAAMCRASMTPDF